MRLTTSVETKGPIFRGTAPQALKNAMELAVKELIQDGESILAQKLRPAPQGVYEGSLVGGTRVQTTTGNYRRNVSSRINNLNGLITDGGVVYGPWLEGVSTKNNRRFPGYLSFRKTGQELQKKSREVFNKHLRRFVDRMNR